MTGKVFLTGASAGIGLSTTRQLLKQGFEVWGTSRDIERLPKMPNFHPVMMDLGKSESVSQAWREALQQAGSFEVVINNAGAGHFGAAEKMDPTIWREQMEVLFHAPLQLTQLALEEMLQKDSGTIIQITSLAVRLPIPFMAPYNAAKAAFSAATQTLQLELKSSRVRLIELQPGDISTPFHQAMECHAIDPKENNSLQRAYQVIDHNMQHAPSPECVAKAIVKILKTPSVRGRVTIGDFFQTRIAPLGLRLFPSSWMQHLLHRYYKL